jgi:acetyltransferase-like isoleucine patch superfamily enzyme
MNHSYFRTSRRAYLIVFPLIFIRRLIINFFHSLGFLNVYRSTIHGPVNRLFRGKNVGHGNNIFYNTRSGRITIGDDCILSFNCMFLTGRHEFENGQLKERSKQVPESGYDIVIGKGCWIASGVIVLGGVTIGDNCIIAAGSVVTKSFGSGILIGGVPAKVLKKIAE